jgi:hypothetical protein
VHRVSDPLGPVFLRIDSLNDSEGARAARSKVARNRGLVTSPRASRQSYVIPSPLVSRMRLAKRGTLGVADVTSGIPVYWQHALVVACLEPDKLDPQVLA